LCLIDGLVEPRPSRTPPFVSALAVADLMGTDIKAQDTTESRADAALQKRILEYDTGTQTLNPYSKT